MRLAELAGLRVAILGFGREGRAAWQALRQRHPDQQLSLFCGAAEAAAAQALQDPLLRIHAGPYSAAALAEFDVVIKSPGISPYRAPVAELLAAGVRLISGSAIWFAEHPDARTICITGTKGKSTTSALTAHLLRALGVRTALCGNIGLPLLDLLDPAPAVDCWVIELSSFQTLDFGGAPTVAVITNLIEEHLDWHGSVEQYLSDKLGILGHDPATLRVLNAEDPVSRQRAGDAGTRWFNDASGWHVHGGHLCLANAPVIALAQLALAGIHNASNACAALTAIAAAGYDARAAAEALTSFQPLPHRQQSLGTRDGIEYINDSIATTPQASMAALDRFQGRDIVLILGGQDRGLDWTPLRGALHAAPPRRIICTGAVATRVHSLLAADASLRPLLDIDADFNTAFALARRAADQGGVVLLSPGAPSFGQFSDYVERGRHFAQLAGFDPDTITGIAGLGIA
jgi:UDP-N-acetylmuramoyl-L-alanine---L-glutamate ligase